MERRLELFLNLTSPYARLVRVAALELGVAGRIAFREVDPWADPADFHAVAPLGKVPALIADDGSLIVQSLEICRHLDRLDGKLRLGSDRPEVSARAALAQGVIDAAFAVVVERRRPRELQWQDWIARQVAAVRRSVPRLALDPGRFDLGDVAAAVALAYLDFRLPEAEWRRAAPDLVRGFAETEGRPSMVATQPGAPLR